MINIEAMVADFAAEATCDYVGLWQIAGEVEYELDPIDDLTYRPDRHSQDEIRGVRDGGCQAFDGGRTSSR